LHFLLPFFVSLGLLITMTCLSLGLGFALPPGAQLPIHFDFTGAPDGYASAWLALSMLPAATALTTLLFALGPLADKRIHSRPGRYVALWLFVTLAMAIGHGFIIRGALFALKAAAG
jgi:uncharacterized membrane protein